jgi:hypothetical protein
MITRERLDDVMKRIDRILMQECGDPQGIPFVLVVMEHRTDPEHGEGTVLRCTGNTHEAMARDMLVKAAQYVLETEYDPDLTPMEKPH